MATNKRHRRESNLGRKEGLIMTNDKIAIKGKYSGYTIKELLKKYKEVEDKWIKEEENYQKELEEITKSIKSTRY